MLSVDPSPVGRVVTTTTVHLSGTGHAPDRAFPHVGGLDDQIKALREIVSLPFEHPDLFAELGIDPPRGVLFTGPPGCGKTLLARAVAAETEAAFFSIDGPEILSKHYGDSERRLREVFSQAAASGPALIFIDELDAIAPRRDALSGEKQVERRIVAQLLTLLDGISDRGQVVVIAATNMPNALDPALRRPGRFDREIVFTPPGRDARRSILAVQTAAMPLGDSVDLDTLADVTHGYVGADLAALSQEAAVAAAVRAAPLISANERSAKITVEAADFEAALRTTQPSTLRADMVDRPAIRWSDIGGLGAVKSALEEAVVWPLRHRSAFDTLALSRARGILLSGPPGTGKTLIAQALACESGVNFIALRGAGLLGHYLGEAERAIADAFTRARHAAPAILFFDELDTLAPRRGTADAALDRVIAELLVEIDGISPRTDVFLLGATNRPEAIDPALLRPGRFDMTLRIEPPGPEARLEILKVHCRRLPMDRDLDIASFAQVSAGWTGADLANLCQTAARNALRRAISHAHPNPPDPEVLAVNQADFQTAFADIRKNDGR